MIIAPPKQELAELISFSIPDLKVGTLDILVTSSDELQKFDQHFEGFVNKLTDTLEQFVSKDVLYKNLLVEDKSVDSYIKSFRWNEMKYRIDKSIPEITERITSEFTSIENDFKSKLNLYNAIKGNLSAATRKQTGNLSVKSLHGIVKKEHCIQDSEYVTTLFVAVPRSSYRQWENSYESLTQFVVPRSSSKIDEDQDFGLFSVALFRKVQEEFSQKCREQRFIPREYEYDEAQVSLQKMNQQELVEKEKQHLTHFLEWSKAVFGDVFSAWVHVKALRIFVESVLRYGLPPDFLCALIKPHPKSDRKVKHILNERYAYLDSLVSSSQLVKRTKNMKINTEDLPPLEEFQSFINQDYTPYVLFFLNWSR